MIPIGAIEFKEYKGSGANTGHEVLIGRLELGQSLAFTKYEQDHYYAGKKQFLVDKRNEIRRAMWERIVRDFRDQVYESSKMVKQHAHPVSREDWKHIEAAFELLFAMTTYDPVKMDERLPDGRSALSQVPPTAKGEERL